MGAFDGPLWPLKKFADANQVAPSIAEYRRVTQRGLPNAISKRFLPIDAQLPHPA